MNNLSLHEKEYFVPHDTRNDLRLGTGVSVDTLGQYVTRDFENERSFTPV